MRKLITLLMLLPISVLAQLIEFDIHYRKDSDGSFEEYSK